MSPAKNPNPQSEWMRHRDKNNRKRRLKKNLKQCGSYLCVSRHIMDKVIHLVQPGVTVTEISHAMDADWHVASRLMYGDWVAEEKLDRFLCAFSCEHLWFDEPLSEIREELIRRAA